MAKTIIKKKKEDALAQFQITGITINQFAFSDDEYNADPSASLSIDPFITFSKNPHQSTVTISVRLKIRQKENHPFLILEVSNHFRISPEDWTKMAYPDGLILPNELAVYFCLLTIASARGILHCKLENTPIAKFVLPDIDVRATFKEDIQII